MGQDQNISTIDEVCTSENDVRMGVVRELKEFYAKNKISVEHFKCDHAEKCLAECRKDSPNIELHHGIEAYVGRKYGSATRVVVVSLDVGQVPNEDDRVLEGRGKALEEIDGKGSIEKCRLNPHMRGTYLFLQALFGDEISGGSPVPYFSMLNSAKCSRVDSMDMVPKSVHEKCKDYALEEIKHLRPQIVWLQGTTVKEIFSEKLQPLPNMEIQVEKWLAKRSVSDKTTKAVFTNIANEYIRHIVLGNGMKAIVVLSPHPSDRWGRWGLFDRTVKDAVGAMAKEFALASSE